MKVFKNYKNLVFGISTKKDGSMKIKGQDSSGLKQTLTNRQKFLKKYKIDHELAVKATLAHGNFIKEITPIHQGKFIPRCDGLITKDKKMFLTVTIADCLPIFLYETKKEIIALIHSGWKGLYKKILTKAVQKISNLGGKSENILVFIGPGISKCHFEVKKDVLRKFKDYKDVVSVNNFKTYLDIKEVARKQLIQAKVQEKNIEVSPECTYCLKDKYFSYRRDGKDNFKAQIAVFGMK